MRGGRGLEIPMNFPFRAKYRSIIPFARSETPVAGILSSTAAAVTAGLQGLPLISTS